MMRMLTGDDDGDDGDDDDDDWNIGGNDDCHDTTWKEDS